LTLTVHDEKEVLVALTEELFKINQCMHAGFAGCDQFRHRSKQHDLFSLLTRRAKDDLLVARQ